MSTPILAGRVVSGPVSARITIDSRPYLNFFGAGYLALSGVPAIRAAALHALEQGLPFSQQLPAAHGARDAVFDAVEQAGAVATAREASVYFASGYLIGSVGLASLGDSYDVVILDEASHFSLRDAAKLSGRPTFTFAHCDVSSLQDLLAKQPGARRRPVLMTDGAFATTGRIPPLPEYSMVLEKYGGRIFTDESHSFGVVGAGGRGALEYCGVEQIATAGATLSKAFCANGAILGCSAAVAAKLRWIPPIGAACAGSPVSAAAATASLKYVAANPQMRVELRALTDYLRRRLRGLGVSVIDSPAPIVAFRWGGRDDMRELQRRAFERGIYIHYSTYVGAGAEGMIRCAVFRDHCRGDIDALVALIKTF